MFSNRYVRTIFMSQIFLQLGIWIRNFAILLYVTALTANNPAYVSLISVVEYAPIFIFAIIGGTFADRWMPKRTMVWCELLSAASVVVVMLFVNLGSWYALLMGTFVSASLSQFSQPSASKLYKKHVSPEMLQGVMALSQSLVAIFLVIGPAAGAFIYQQFGITVSLMITAVMFLGAAITLAGLPKDSVEQRESGVPQGFAKEMAAGFRYIRANQALRTLSTVFASAGFAAGIIQPLMLFVVIDRLGLKKEDLQWFMMANGVAMLIGGALIMTIAKKLAPHTLLTMGLLISAVCTIGIGISTAVTISMILQVISGLFYPCIQIGIQTLIIKNTETAYIGRVGGTITPVFMGMMIIGMMGSGYFMSTFSLLAVYAVSGVLLMVGAGLLIPLFKPNKALSTSV